MDLSRAALGESKNADILGKCLDVVVDTGPRSSSGDRSLFGGKMFPRVKTISCGGTNRICTQLASKNSASPIAFPTLRFYGLFAYSTADTFRLVCSFTSKQRHNKALGIWITPALCSVLLKSAEWRPSGPLGPVNASMFATNSLILGISSEKIQMALHLATRKVEEVLWACW